MDGGVVLNHKQGTALTTLGNEVLYGGAAGGGKLVSTCRNTLTTKGWKKFGDIHPGDSVFGDDGKPTMVIAESPIVNEDSYRVTFDDGHSEIVHLEHEWYTQTYTERSNNTRRSPEFRAKRKANRPTRGTGKKPWLAEKNANREYVYDNTVQGGIRTTREIMETLTARGGSHTNHGIPIAKPLVFPEQGLLIPPYTLGAWLGDGSTGCGGFTGIDPEIWGNIEKDGFVVTHSVSKDKSHYICGLIQKLKQLDIVEKHIPDVYKYSSFEQRLALVQGILDTDGHIRKSGNCELCLSDERLANDILEVIRSLGIKCTQNQHPAYLYGVRKKDRYRMKFTTTLPVFRLQRKLDLIPTTTREITRYWFITDVQKVDDCPKKCIQVDNESHLYLIGEELVPTHNSYLMRYASIIFCSAIPGIQVYLFRRKYNDLQQNHLFGPSGYAVIMQPFEKEKIAKINYSDNRIDFANGSRIFLRHCQHEKDVYNYQGAEIHVLMIDELTHFSKKIYSFLRSRVRLGGFVIDYNKLHKEHPEFAWMKEGFFPRILCGTNPGGIGHSWCKQAWVDSAPPMKIWHDKKDGNMYRVFIPATLVDNPIMKENDPDYEDRLRGLSDPALAEAMLTGNWDIISGGAIDDIWKRDIHVIEPFDIPKDWMVDRTFDWGSAKPFAVCYWAESNGNPIRYPNGKELHTPPGTLFLIDEIYGWNGTPDEGCKLSARHVGDKIRRFEETRSYKNQIVPGAADSSIWASLGAREESESILDNIMFGYNNGVEEYDENHNPLPRIQVDGYTNTLFEKADKSPGSRIKGLELVRSYLKASTDVPMENKGLFIFNRCIQFIRTVPILPRSESNPEDVDTDAEDHLFDCLRYRLFTKVDHFQHLELIGF